jgi:hypothetical protein
MQAALLSFLAYNSDNTNPPIPTTTTTTNPSRYHPLLYYHYHYDHHYRHRRARHTAIKQSNPELAYFSLQHQKKKQPTPGQQPRGRNAGFDPSGDDAVWGVGPVIRLCESDDAWGSWGSGQKSLAHGAGNTTVESAFSGITKDRGGWGTNLFRELRVNHWEVQQTATGERK